MVAFLLLCLLFCLSFGQTYYVTNTGSASNAGTAASPWSLTHAVATAKAGDTVHVRAGVYANVKLLQTTSGTAANPIRFIGYRSTPGDISSTTQPTWMYGNNMDGSDMPLLRENRAGTTGSGVALEVRGSYCTWENFQIRYYDKNLVVRGNYFRGTNLIARDAGNFASKNAYAGVGMQLSGSFGVYRNLVCINAGAQCISTYGDGNRHTGVWITCDQDLNPTDYYFHIAGSNNWSGNINTRRTFKNSHTGHGIAFKNNKPVQNNVVDGFRVINSVTEIQFPQTTNNTMRNGYVEFERGVGSQWKNDGALTVANGAFKNLIEDVYLKDCVMQARDWNDGLPGDVADSGNDNVFRRIVVDGGQFIWKLAAENVNVAGSVADRNHFYQISARNNFCVFFNGKKSTDNRFYNCAFQNVKQLLYYPTGLATPATFDSVNCENCGFTLPNAVRSTTLETKWVNPDAGDFSLAADSPLRGRGIATTYTAAGSDLGAIQSNGGPAPPTPTDAPPAPATTTARTNPPPPPPTTTPVPPTNPPTPTTFPANAPVVLSVVAESITETGFDVRFTISQKSTARLEYGMTTAYGSMTAKESSYNYATHLQRIRGLQPGTVYHFRVIETQNAAEVKGAPSGDFTATTLGTKPPGATAPPTNPPTNPPTTTSAAGGVLPTTTAASNVPPGQIPNGIGSCIIQNAPVAAHSRFTLRFDHDFRLFDCDFFLARIAGLFGVPSSSFRLIGLWEGSTGIDYACTAAECPAAVAALAARVQNGEEISEFPSRILDGTDTSGNSFSAPGTAGGVPLPLLIGIIVAAVVIIAVVVVLIICCVRRRQSLSKSQSSASPLGYKSMDESFIPLVSTSITPSQRGDPRRRFTITQNVQGDDQNSILGVRAGEMVSVLPADLTGAEWTWAVDDLGREGYVPTVVLG